MKKLNLSILWLSVFVIFAPAVFAFNTAMIEEDIKEALIKRDMVKVTKIADTWRQEIDTAPVPYFLLAYSYYAKGDYQKVPGLLNVIDTRDKKELLLAWADKFSREYPQDPIPYLLKGDACIRLKKYEQAIKEFDMAEEFAPRLFLVYAAKGMFYAFQNSYDLAIENFNQAIKLEPNSADIYNSRGITYYCQGDYLSALSDFNQAIKINPKFTLAYLGRGKVYHCLEKDDLASADSKRAKEINQEGFAISRTSINDPSTGKIIHKFSAGLDIKPEIKTPEGKLYSFGRLQGVDSTPEGEIMIIKKGDRGEKILDNQFILPALSFLLYNDQFFFGAERARRN